MSTYNHNGSLRGNFDDGRHEMEDRGPARNFFNSYGWTVKDNDTKEGKLNYREADLVAEKKINGANLEMLVECATKSQDCWKCVFYGGNYGGVDIEERKTKYFGLESGQENNTREGVEFMVDADKSEVFVVYKDSIESAVKACRTKNGYNYEGMGKVQSSPGFVRPPHNCRMIRKWVKQPDKSFKMEDFIRVPYEYVDHLKINSDGTYSYLHKGRSPEGIEASKARAILAI